MKIELKDERENLIKILNESENPTADLQVAYKNKLKWILLSFVYDNDVFLEEYDGSEIMIVEQWVEKKLSKKKDE